MRTYIAKAFQVINGKKAPFKSCKVTGIDKDHAKIKASLELDIHQSVIKIKSI